MKMFGKTTIMNLANLAEAKGAQMMYLVLDRKHEQKAQFERMFKMIDADRVATAGV